MTLYSHIQSSDIILEKEDLHEKNHAENKHQKLIPDLFLVFLNNSKQPLHARNSFTNRIF